MKKLIGIAVGILALGMVATAQGEDCPNTPWRNNGGKSCQQVGLDSRRGTCLPGDEYETLCDDAPQGIKTCRGPNRCQQAEGRRDHRHQRDDGYRNDYDDRRPDRNW